MPTVESIALKVRAELSSTLGVTEYPCPREYWKEWERCKNDVCYWVETYVKTYDPRLPEGERWVTFNLWPRQREYLEWLKERYKMQQPCIVKKCRDVGATWLTLCFFQHIWLFEQSPKLAVGSRKDELVDNPGNPDALYTKMRDTLKGLPDWMRPKYISLEKKLINEWSGGAITGESGDNIGRGGRSSGYFIDEFADILHSTDVQAAVEDNARFRVYVSTPKGMGNEFARIWLKKLYPGFEFTFKDDPRRNQWLLTSPVDGWRVDKLDSPLDGDTEEFYKFQISDGATVAEQGSGRDAPPGAVYPWYEQEKLKRNPVNLAQEVDGDIFASVEDAVCPAEWVKAATEAVLKAEGPIVAGLDLGNGVRATTVFAPRIGPVCSGVYRKSGPTGKAVEALVAVLNKHGIKVERVIYDAAGSTGRAFSDAVKKWEKLPFVLSAFIGQRRPTRRTWPDNKRSDELFERLRDEAWWCFRERLRKTWENMYIGAEHPESECCSIPKDDLLLQELMMVQYKRTETDKIKVESKQSMRDRGVDSPDSADAVVYAYFINPPARRGKGRFDKQ